MFKKIAILYTSHNRREKTILSLASLWQSTRELRSQGLYIAIYLTDDGSTDGTTESIRSQFPFVKIINGSGTLYWAEGMRRSWTEALKQDYDAYLLLNDDVELYSDSVAQFYPK